MTMNVSLQSNDYENLLGNDFYFNIQQSLADLPQEYKEKIKAMLVNTLDNRLIENEIIEIIDSELFGDSPSEKNIINHIKGEFAKFIDTYFQKLDDLICPEKPFTYSLEHYHSDWFSKKSVQEAINEKAFDEKTLLDKFELIMEMIVKADKDYILTLELDLDETQKQQVPVLAIIEKNGNMIFSKSQMAIL